jgi:hypothetical protein
MNKRDTRTVEAYNNATATTLRQVYGRYSMKKEEAYNNCIRLKVEMNGRDFRIIGASAYLFSAGFVFDNEQGEECLMYITKGGNRVIKL